ncbi:MAG: hypothetical protein IJX71_04190 [Oscillospiraceae bacterium]|nr:hypothetical protein [Oscillospiraceae bacterium]
MRKIKVLLAALTVFALLVAASLIPTVSFHIQDRELEGKREHTVDAPLNLELSDGERTTYWERMKLVTSAGYLGYLMDYQMELTSEAAQERTAELLHGFQPEAALQTGEMEPYENQASDTSDTAESGAVWMMDVPAAYYVWDKESNLGFRAWEIFLYRPEGSGYISIQLDDHTGLPLKVYCSDSDISDKPYVHGMEIQSFDDVALAQAERIMSVYTGLLSEDTQTDWKLESRQEEPVVEEMENYGGNEVKYRYSLWQNEQQVSSVTVYITDLDWLLWAGE